MHPVSALERLGGVASRRALLGACEKSALKKAVTAGDVVRDARGRYALPATAAAIRTASAASGTLSHSSAALEWGWEVKRAPTLPHVTFPRSRKLPPGHRRMLIPHWADLSCDEISQPGVTDRERTLSDCMAHLALDEGLCIADSALRHGDVTPAGLIRIAATTIGPGSARARRIAAKADGRAANPFESVLRAISLDVRGLELIPQQNISWPGFHARPDLVDRDLRLAVEADSHQWHSSRAALRRDCQRYNALTLGNWIVLRFTWEDVMGDSQLVRGTLSRSVEHAHSRLRRRQSG